jgi:hypothetical protein
VEAILQLVPAPTALKGNCQVITVSVQKDLGKRACQKSLVTIVTGRSRSKRHYLQGVWGRSIFT